MGSSDITTEPWKHGSGPGGQKVNKKASGGRARCNFDGKLFLAESKIGRDTEYNQDKARKLIPEKINAYLNKERSSIITKKKQIHKEEILSLVNVPYEHPDKLYRID